MAVFHDAGHLEPRYPAPRPAAIPTARLADMLNRRDGTPALKREPASGTITSVSTPTQSCGPKDTTGICQRPVDGTTNTTLPITLGVAIPIIVALVIFAVLHRRHVRKLRNEDASDRHRALDFGMDETEKPTGKKSRHGKAVQGMSVTETKDVIRRGRGLSMDGDLTNPYLLPPGLQQSRQSLHSLSRTINNGDDKYQSAAIFTSNDSNGPYPAKTTRTPDDSSSYTGSSSRRGLTLADSRQNLIPHTQRMSPSLPSTQRNSLGSGTSTLISPEPFLSKGSTVPRKTSSPTPPVSAPAHATSGEPRSSFVDAVSKAGDDYLGAFIRGGDMSKNNVSEHSLSASLSAAPHSVSKTTIIKEDSVQSASSTIASSPPDNTNDTLSADLISAITLHQTQLNHTFGSANSNDGLVDMFPVVPPSTDLNLTERQESKVPEVHVIESPKLQQALNAQQEPQDAQKERERLSTGVRPLPPDDPNDNPEQRASRIRSFYKEYFDETKPRAVNPPVDYYESQQYYENDAPAYEYPTGQYVPAPFAVPVPRRAMTPPPSGVSRLRGFERTRTVTYSDAYIVPGPRAYSSASGWYGMAGKATPAKKRLPPPSPLQILPTPHMLKDDTFLPIDFAPPSTYKERKARTPESPKGGLRPLSSVHPVHLPLASSFDDLAVMPSPHALRKSSTFTALDFAPPPRFKTGDSGSDSVSLRSSRSGVSPAQVQNIRAGAYRVSRLPREVAGTKDELATSLRPQWDMRN